MDMPDGQHVTLGYSNVNIGGLICSDAYGVYVYNHTAGYGPGVSTLSFDGNRVGTAVLPSHVTALGMQLLMTTPPAPANSRIIFNFSDSTSDTVDFFGLNSSTPQFFGIASDNPSVYITSYTLPIDNPPYYHPDALSIAYGTYSPVPEPSSLSLLAVGTLALVRRCRRNGTDGGNGDVNECH